jgi:hypothetical protein
MFNLMQWLSEQISQLEAEHFVLPIQSHYMSVMNLIVEVLVTSEYCFMYSDFFCSIQHAYTLNRVFFSILSLLWNSQSAVYTSKLSNHDPIGIGIDHFP